MNGSNQARDTPRGDDSSVTCHKQTIAPSKAVEPLVRRWLLVTSLCPPSNPTGQDSYPPSSPTEQDHPPRLLSPSLLDHNPFTCVGCARVRRHTVPVSMCHTESRRCPLAWDMHRAGYATVEKPLIISPHVHQNEPAASLLPGTGTAPNPTAAESPTVTGCTIGDATGKTCPFPTPVPTPWPLWHTGSTLVCSPGGPCKPRGLS